MPEQNQKKMANYKTNDDNVKRSPNFYVVIICANASMYT